MYISSRKIWLFLVYKSVLPSIHTFLILILLSRRHTIQIRKSSSHDCVHLTHLSLFFNIQNLSFITQYTSLSLSLFLFWFRETPIRNLILSGSICLSVQARHLLFYNFIIDQLGSITNLAWDSLALSVDPKPLKKKKKREKPWSNAPLIRSPTRSSQHKHHLILTHHHHPN